MTIALRLTNGTLIVPTRLQRDGYRGSESVVESATVHADRGFVVLDPGTTEFTIAGPPETEKAAVLLRYERITTVPGLPEAVTTDEEMADLRTRWENVDAFYRRVEDVTTSTSTPTRTVSVADMRILDVDHEQIAHDAAGWEPDPEYLGIPSQLAALVPGRLRGVPQLVEDQIKGKDRRVNLWPARHGQETATLLVEFQVAYEDARTRMVKKDPTNNRRNAKRVPITDTKYVELHTQVPLTIAATSPDIAHAEVDRIVGDIEAQLGEPVALCTACAGDGLVLTGDVRPWTRR
ncbi:Uncharacterised protein (plasmid) [Tsukamurella tyrosinosolvens]|uniref:Uncharacterized protein n=1 Tax=Tsukamurella tyrosinosolvens TaxID=57704 RepID=A0A1H4UZA4_TSUTY|nr:hypothetical protein [Tsukamurella tyrosinosolvens]KXO98417.1 hypothetical protein AXK58_25425 [Tsukamurella tyrosinosolvens]SEC73531.1 hypothetical protein SAMN04489793_3074 [Tsukamurella tyrosinosolvens]VEH90813.1 Uncharacterised protein [Tsukamurella tyrosinosolvens]